MIDKSALYKIGYGLYVVTSNDGVRDNGMICNTVVQVADAPLRVAVTINKRNHTHHVVNTSGHMNVCVLDESAPFSIFERFGFKSGRDTDKFDGFAFTRGTNGLAILSSHVNAVYELNVMSYIDLGSHGMFICDVAQAKTLSSGATMTYAYYHANVKKLPQAAATAGSQPSALKKWVCKICGYVYDPAENNNVAFEDLPEDWLCPWCKHPKSDFEPLG